MVEAKEIRNKVRNYVEDEFYLSLERIDFNDDTSFMGEELMDSVGGMELVAFLDTTFNIKIADNEIKPDNLDSVNKVVAFVEGKVNPEA